MTRKCERPSCRERGEVAYVIDTANLLVSVDSPIPRDSSRVNVLCRRHADSLVVPRDWQIIDNRTKKQRLFSAPASQSVRTSSRSSSVKKQKREKGKTGAVIQDLFEFATRVVAAPAREPEPILETVSVPEVETEIETEIETIDPQETQAMPWTPQFDRTGDLDGRLRARGRLLSRAFGASDASDQGHEIDQDHDHDQHHPEY
ncbi:MAG: hypothetical protein NWS60_03225 [Ilumatobacteraceae bacterium]|jgi:hypothetical protein|nr:hypothetical protein [Ilumatobacteraceae bacterium]MDP4851139.1 hypothetical protein [Ilumatobacteraceae bacterium]MDP5087217.1 hypothetical protein [Ilumatobacteraceae bacterium]